MSAEEKDSIQARNDAMQFIEEARKQDPELRREMDLLQPYSETMRLLTAERINRGLTNEEFAIHMGMSKRKLFRFLEEKEPLSIKHMQDIADKLGYKLVIKYERKED